MIYVFLADGFEEIEALAPVDILRRAGFEVRTVGVTGKTVCGSHKINVEADILPPDNYNDAELVVLPGGKVGMMNLRASSEVQKAIKYCSENGIRLAAICASPSVLGEAGLLSGKRATCFPGFEDKLFGAIVCGEGVVTDGLVTTAKSAGHSVEFGLELVRLLSDIGKAEQLRQSIMQI